MRVASLFLATVPLVWTLSTGQAQAADPKAWVGRYPSDKIGGVDFWHNLGSKLDSTVGPQLAKSIRGGWGPEGPVQRIEGWTIAGKCKAHECNTQNVTILINDAGRMIACVHRADQKPPIRWQEIGQAVVPLDHDCKDGPHLIDDMVWSGIWKR